MKQITLAPIIPRLTMQELAQNLILVSNVEISVNRSLNLLLENAQETDWNDVSKLRLALLEIASHPDATEYQFQDAANIALDFDSPQTALDIHNAYMRRFGKGLSGDVSRRDIEADLKSKTKEEVAKKAFIRQTFFQRGHFSNYFTVHPVRKIVITPRTITFTVSHYYCLTRSYEYGHSDVLEIRLRERESWKSFGGGSSKIKERTCKVISKKRSFLFDVSASCGDFRNPRELIEGLAKICIVQNSGTDWQ